MRKLFALAMVAILSLTIALAVMGCSQKQETSTETTPPPEQTSMPADTGAAADTGMSQMGQDTSMHK
jgi:PBP1b-binding outer membrane lipoprotein LpoB